MIPFLSSQGSQQTAASLREGPWRTGLSWLLTVHQKVSGAPDPTSACHWTPPATLRPTGPRQGRGSQGPPTRCGRSSSSLCLRGPLPSTRCVSLAWVPSAPPQPPEVWVSPLNIDNMQILPHSPQPPPLPTPGLVRALVHLPAQEAPAPGPLHFLCLLRRTRNLLAWPFPSSSSSLGCSVPQRSLPCLGSPTLPAFSLSCLVHVLFV